ncbi:MAG: NUDIX domain-containing protein [Chloroflexi bacterium]|nr:NUDIX domain-containing protein [Chloroflexota bacterium]
MRFVAHEGAERFHCPGCGGILYCNPKVVAVTRLVHGGRLYLVRRATPPGRGGWAMPGGYVEVGESAEEAAQRETLEETGLAVELLGLTQVLSGGPVVVVVYDARVAGGQARPGTEVAEVASFLPDEAPLADLAFPEDRHLLEAWAWQPPAAASSFGAGDATV